MKEFGFVIDSTFYITEEEVKKHDVAVVDLNVIDGEKSYKESEITPEFTYKRQDEGAGLTTSQPSPQEFLDAYDAQFKKGYTRLYVFTLSKGLSGTYQSATIARNESEHKENIYVFDTNNAAYGNALIFLEAMKIKDRVKSPAEFEKEVQKVIEGVDLLFNVENLFSLQQGGRLSKTQAILGTAMRVKPMLVLEEGKLTLGGKARTYAKLLDIIVEKMQAGKDDKKTLVARIISINSEDALTQLKDRIGSSFAKVEIQETRYIGPVFSVHVGKKGFGVAWYYRSA
jgi:DegV family protein with EDD domain